MGRREARNNWPLLYLAKRRIIYVRLLCSMHLGKESGTEEAWKLKLVEAE